MGECPDWYAHLLAAKWAGVAPWELAEQSEAWLYMILGAMAAEQAAEKKRQEDEAKRTRTRR